MSRRKISAALLLVLILPLSFCSEKGDDGVNKKQKPYSIFLGEFVARDQIEKFRLSLNTVLYNELRIEKIYDRNFKLYFGEYSSSFEAGQSAFELLTKSLIAKNYKITRDGKRVLDSYANVLFVSKYLGRQSVFSFNLISKQTEVEWSSPVMRVASLNYASDHSTAFITSVSALGRKGGMNFIHDARVHLIKREEERNSELESLGEGVQLYTYWENRDTFKVNFSSIDSINSKIVVQTIYPFDIRGNEGSVRQRRYDLLHDGFPAPPGRTPSMISPGGRFRFREVYSNGESYIYLRDFDEKSEQLTATIFGKIADGRWSEDGNYLFIVTDRSQGEGKDRLKISGELLIINAIEKKLIRIFSGFNYGNLLVHGKLLFFDERSDSDSRIEVYDYMRDKIIHTISMYRGCGLNNLPL